MIVIPLFPLALPAVALLLAVLLPLAALALVLTIATAAVVGAALAVRRAAAR